MGPDLSVGGDISGDSRSPPCQTQPFRHRQRTYPDRGVGTVACGPVTVLGNISIKCERRAHGPGIGGATDDKRSERGWVKARYRGDPCCQDSVSRPGSAQEGEGLRRGDLRTTAGDLHGTRIRFPTGIAGRGADGWRRSHLSDPPGIGQYCIRDSHIERLRGRVTQGIRSTDGHRSRADWEGGARRWVDGGCQGIPRGVIGRDRKGNDGRVGSRACGDSGGHADHRRCRPAAGVGGHAGPAVGLKFQTEHIGDPAAASVRKVDREDSVGHPVGDGVRVGGGGEGLPGEVRVEEDLEVR